MQNVRGQRRAAPASCARLQSWQLSPRLQHRNRSKDWSLTSSKEKLIKIGAKVVSHGRYVVFQMSEVAIPRQMFQEILRLIADYASIVTKSNRQEECVQMRAKIARSTPR
jgi:hypothetical protein